MTPDKYPELREAYYTDATVHRCLCENLSLSETINALVTDKKAFFNELMKLHAIAPRKIKLPDGRIMVWHCPDHLIPETL